MPVYQKRSDQKDNNAYSYTTLKKDTMDSTIKPETDSKPADVPTDSNSPVAAGKKVSLPSNLGIIKLNTENVLQGLIYSEVFGKPKAKRRGRW